MKTILLVVLMSIAAATDINAQSPGLAANKIADHLAGSWKLSKVYDGKKELPVKSQLGIIDHITFTSDALYISHFNNAEIDSGFYRTNENDHLLYLESAKGNTTDEWSLTTSSQVITLSRREPVELRRFKYVYIRKNK